MNHMQMETAGERSITARYSVGEEIAHAVTHGLGVILSIAGLAVLVAFATLYGDAWHVVSSSIYGATLILLFSASTLYHGIPAPRAKRVLRIIDHSAIYLLIAGTYTPFTLVSLRGNWGWTLFGVAWGLALLGVFLETVAHGRFKRLAIGFYLALGWMAVVAIKPLWDAVATGGLVLLLTGGLFYSLGVLFYVRRQMAYHHAVWHLFVLAGSACHFFAILFYVIPDGA